MVVVKKYAIVVKNSMIGRVKNVIVVEKYVFNLLKIIIFMSKC